MTCTIVVNPRLIAYVDDEDAPILRRFTWSRSKGRNTDYAATFIDGCFIQMHRMILGLCRDDQDIDHINGNGLDNRKSNIRLATGTINNLNRPVPAVRARHNVHGTVFHAQIKVEGVAYHLGTFQTEDTALRIAALNRRRLLRGQRMIAYKADYPRGPRRRIMI